jgi:hypothetical protein
MLRQLAAFDFTPLTPPIFAISRRHATAPPIIFTPPITDRLASYSCCFYAALTIPVALPCHDLRIFTPFLRCRHYFSIRHFLDADTMIDIAAILIFDIFFSSLFSF